MTRKTDRSEGASPTTSVENAIRSRPLRSRRSVLLAFGGAAGVTAVGGLTGSKAQAGDKKADFQDLNYDAKNNSDHYGGTSDSD